MDKFISYKKNIQGFRGIKYKILLLVQHRRWSWDILCCLNPARAARVAVQRGNSTAVSLVSPALGAHSAAWHM